MKPIFISIEKEINKTLKETMSKALNAWWYYIAQAHGWNWKGNKQLLKSFECEAKNWMIVIFIRFIILFFFLFRMAAACIRYSLTYVRSIDCIHNSFSMEMEPIQHHQGLLSWKRKQIVFCFAFSVRLVLCKLNSRVPTKRIRWHIPQLESLLEPTVAEIPLQEIFSHLFRKR